MSSRRDRVTAVLVLCAYTVLAVLLFAETWASPATRLVGGCCDSPSYAWYLRWFPHALAGGDTGLHSTHLNAPDGINLMWQASMPLLSVVSAPLQPLLGPYVTHNVLATLALSLSGFTAYLALRRWVGGYAGPVVGGLLFGFSSHQIAHSLGHPNFTFVPLVPLVFLAVDDVLVRQTRRWWSAGLWLGCLVAAQLLVGEEVLASTAVVTLVLAVVLAALHPRLVRERLAYAARASGVAVVTATALAAYPLWVQFAGRQRIEGVIRPPGVHVQDLLGFVEPTGLVAVSGEDGCLRCAELGGYLGWPLLLLAVVAAVAGWRRLEVRVAALAGLAAAVLSLGPRLVVDIADRGEGGVPLPWALLDRVPVLQNMLPTRLTLYTHLAVALLAADGVRRALASRRLRAPLAIAGAAVAVTLFPALPYQSYSYATPAFFRGDGVERLPEGETAFVLPFPGTGPGTVEPVLWQAEADFRFRMPGGYVLAPVDGRTTNGGRTTLLRNHVHAVAATGALPALDDALRARLLDQLRGYYAARSVIVGPMPHRDAMVAFWTDLLGRPPEDTGGVALWLGV